jgi:hypothetical protein
MNICEGSGSRHNGIEQRPADEGWRVKDSQVNLLRDREDRKRYFAANFKLGSTTVLKHNGEFFFRGDIRHCGTDNIFFNARKIKSMMQANGQTMGHMNYNDPPTFSSKWDWEREEKERKTMYQDDLYKFVGDQIVVADLIGAEPIGHIYKDDPSGSEGAVEPSAQKDVALDTPARW